MPPVHLSTTGWLEPETVIRFWEELIGTRRKALHLGFYYDINPKQYHNKLDHVSICNRHPLVCFEERIITMLNLNSFMIGTKQPAVLAAFYEKVFGQPASMNDSKLGFWMWQLGNVYFTVIDHSEMGGKTKDPGRMMFNLETAQVRQEFERIRALGAVVIREPYELQGGWIATFADPDGNYFQLMTPMETMGFSQP
jgi:predicted enzyme related to lactoylglutathione lyase